MDKEGFHAFLLTGMKLLPSALFYLRILKKLDNKTKLDEQDDHSKWNL